ncbi:anthranilate phosphoribosyltransferase [Aurantimicrobium minutum]|uniref:anthranilate phosphoribosyltransferase n=1 Tax=Aurantimicrobium minutum TaxID=708131 RepID=UPI0024771D3B|nr:anthranilate phosphoribosyltransferase [Aurantimicrobium minutum]MDH6532939.1 anthranilate phosphoribosyltransferase [Aurantimicrobium minutum]
MVHSSAWPDLIAQLIDGSDLSIEQADWAMNQIITGNATNTQIGAFLTALRAKGESVDEVLGFRDAVLSNALELPVSSRALDIVGTGGDRHNSVNISTTASIVAAAAGIPVVKHGNRAASSASGSSDVLSELGINLSLTNVQVADVLETAGITFAFAAAFHPGFRHVAEARRELGIPTIFNVLGPLCNPARPDASAVGVAQLDRIPLVTGVFQSRDATALVFRGDDGLDELTTTGHSHIWEISRGQIVEHDLDPLELGIPRANLADFRGGEPSYNAEVLKDTLTGTTGPIRDIVLLNAAAGMTAFELAQDSTQVLRPIKLRLAEQLERAAAVIDSGAATSKLEQWVLATNSYS